MSAIVSLLHPLSPSWSGRHYQPSFATPDPWRNWLFDSGSLTARLKALAPDAFAVEPTAQGFAKPSFIEQHEMQLGAQEAVWVREVQLKIAGKTLVYARTAIPLQTLTGAERCLMQLGSRSLGSYLFAQPSLRRTELKASRCPSNELGLTWSRRSIFFLHHKPLMVSEAFTQALLDFL